VVPYNTSVEDILKFKPDGLFISNGPGDPEDMEVVIHNIKALKGKLPMLGICLGHQMIGLAYGAKTYKMKFGHRGANHPVKNLLTGKVEITSQNHSYAVDQESLKKTELELTHINLLDNETEGMMDKKNRVIAVQYHPEIAAGPEDSAYIFQGFLDNMKAFKEGK
jgi:carbamoyl-phosphate synthase small subunit